MRWILVRARRVSMFRAAVRTHKQACGVYVTRGYARAACARRCVAAWLCVLSEVEARLPLAQVPRLARTRVASRLGCVCCPRRGFRSPSTLVRPATSPVSSGASAGVLSLVVFLVQYVNPILYLSATTWVPGAQSADPEIGANRGEAPQ